MNHLDLKQLCSHIYLLQHGSQHRERGLIGDELCILLVNCNMFGNVMLHSTI